MRWLKKLAKPVSALGMADPALTFAYRYWSDLKTHGLLPPRCMVDTPDFRLIVPDTMWVDVRSENWQNYELLGPLGPYAMAEAPSAECGATTLGQSLLDDLDTVQISAVPVFQLVFLEIRQSNLLYQRLILPTADDGCHVTEMLQLTIARSLDQAEPIPAMI